MPWGKHEGKRLDDIPANYLRWVLENCRNTTPAPRRAIREALVEPDLQPPRRTGQLAAKQGRQDAQGPRGGRGVALSPRTRL
jgi:hypothetical protein